MVKIPANFSHSKEEIKCICKSKEDMNHIYECKKLNNEKPEVKYEQIYTENIKQIIKVHKRFKQNMKRRNELMDEIEQKKNNKEEILQCDPRDPLYSVYSNG